MSSTQLDTDLGPIPRMTADQIATIRANITTAARDANDARLLCQALGLEAA